MGVRLFRGNPVLTQHPVGRVEGSGLHHEQPCLHPDPFSRSVPSSVVPFILHRIYIIELYNNFIYSIKLSSIAYKYNTYLYIVFYIIQCNLQYYVICTMYRSTIFDKHVQ